MFDLTENPWNLSSNHPFFDLAYCLPCLEGSSGEAGTAVDVFRYTGDSHLPRAGLKHIRGICADGILIIHGDSTPES